MVRILFVHPDLGIGGAERLVVDAAIALQNKGHTVSFLTNHHDLTHCFEETRNGTLSVRTVGDWLPRNIFGKFYALCAYIRMVYAALYTTLILSKNEQIDIIFCDVVSLGIPIFRLAKSNPKIIFYCHFPDQLLTQPGGSLKRLYRMPINYLEEKTTGMADSILVNSKFTRRVFKETFRNISIMPDVVYPSLNIKFFEKHMESLNTGELNENQFIFISINRFERKKNVGLAIRAFRLLEKMLSKNEWDKCELVIAGGYDELVLENLEYFDELETLAENLGINSKVNFIQSPPDKEKIMLLHKSQVVIYTPENEHFGIVPVEAMFMGKPVIAANSGGPTETVIHESTGFLCEITPEGFASAMAKLAKDRSLAERMGEMGQKRVQQQFSFEAFGDKLENIVHQLIVNGGFRKFD